MKKSIAILGDGSWGTAIAIHLAKRDDLEVRLWSARSENGFQLRRDRENRRFLPGIRLSDSITLTDDEKTATEGASIWISAIPTIYLRSTLERFSDLVRDEVKIISLTKGIEDQTFLRPSQIIADTLKVEQIAVLSGPSHAEEVAQGKPTSVVVATEESEWGTQAQKLLNTERFRVYRNHDLIGVEYGGALKNVIGIAAGICDGLGYGDNAKSGLMTRGLAEMARLGVALGAEHATFAGLAGIGDLITTCISPHGRNRGLGERIGRGEKLDFIQSNSPMIAEGVTTCQSVYHLAQKMGIEMPIHMGVYQILYENISPLEGVNQLMNRQMKSE